MKNGSAVEAAIAALFCEGVVCVQSMGLGGGFLMTIYKRDTGEVETLNAREVAPKAANKTMFNGNSTLSTVGVYSFCFNGEKSENSKIICDSSSVADIQCVHKRMVQFQKLTRNLFLTLHGQNVHRQQRQLSQFRMRYQQFAFHAYCGAVGSVSKMAPQQEKAFFVLRFEVSRSVITVQREFRARFRKDAPHRNNITRWYRQFVETGCLCTGKSSGRPRVPNDNVEEE